MKRDKSKLKKPYFYLARFKDNKPPRLVGVEWDGKDWVNVVYKHNGNNITPYV